MKNGRRNRGSNLVIAENCHLAQRSFCAILTFSRDRAIIFAVERNFRATRALFASFEVAACKLLGLSQRK